MEIKDFIKLLDDFQTRNNISAFIEMYYDLKYSAPKTIRLSNEIQLPHLAEVEWYKNRLK
jgi:hypothetical protein